SLDNETDRHRSLEHACLRLQAALLEPLGLRQVLAPTTQYRTFYDSLGADPFALPAGGEDDDSAVRARVGLRRSGLRPWAPHLRRALEATARVIHAVGPGAGSSQAATIARSSVETGTFEMGGSGPTSSLYARVQPRALPHPSGLRADPVAGRTCGTCGWFA